MGALLYQSPVNKFAAIAEFSKKILNFASNKTHVPSVLLNFKDN